jgi:hypothetical protein
MRNAARAIPQVWSKTFWNGIVLLANLQAVKDLGAKIHLNDSITNFVAREFGSVRAFMPITWTNPFKRAPLPW